MADLPAFADLAGAPDPPLDALALALAQEFRDVDVPGALATLDALGRELEEAVTAAGRTPEREADACAALLGSGHGFAGDRKQYDDPDNSMLDLVLARRRGLPILLSVVYVEVARRAGVPLAGIGLPGHFVVGHLGVDPPIVLDPFNGGERVDVEGLAEGLLRPWRAQETAMRMLNNLLAAYQRRGDLASAIRAASMRLALPAAGQHRRALQAELVALQARLN